MVTVCIACAGVCALESGACRRMRGPRSMTFRLQSGVTHCNTARVLQHSAMCGPWGIASRDKTRAQLEHDGERHVSPLLVSVCARACVCARLCVCACMRACVKRVLEILGLTAPSAARSSSQPGIVSTTGGQFATCSRRCMQRSEQLSSSDAPKPAMQRCHNAAWRCNDATVPRCREAEMKRPDARLSATSSPLRRGRS